MRTALATEHLRVTPGVPTTFEVEVTNTAHVIDGVTALIDGLDPAWVQLVTPVVSLFPESTGVIVARLNLPRNCVAGDYLITVRVISTVDPERSSTHQFWLTVEPVTSCALQLRPSTIIGGKRAVFTALVANTGNIAIKVVVRAEEETRAANCVVEPPAITVAPGTIERVLIEATGPRPWFGQSANRTIAVTASTPSEDIPALAQFTQKPRIPRGVLTLLILVGIIALWATVFMVIIGAIRADDDQKKAVPAHFNEARQEGGSNDVLLTSIAGSVSGTVTAKSTGEGVARVTVEARRITADGTLDLIASAATGDDGAYVLETLLPGKYKLKFSGKGFTPVWYPDVGSAGAAEEIVVETGPPGDARDVVIGGTAGSFAGSILAPEGTSDVQIEVFVRRVVEKPVPGQPRPDAVQVPTTRTPETPPSDEPVIYEFALGAVALDAPASYEFTITSDGFEDLVFTEKLGAGETKVLNTLRLGASLGSISGHTLTLDDRPLGAVTVVVSRGEFKKEAVTPTEGNEGEYIIDGLETPNTYVVTFSAEGYATVSLSLDLIAGENENDVDARLSGGVGAVNGSARALDENGALQGIGGIKVSVVGGGFTGEAETLTAGDVGAYQVSGMPTPATYTVTFSSDDYLPETRFVTFEGPESLDAIDVTLRPATGSIKGTVVVPGATATGVDVTLSDGVDPRNTATASVPEGAYSFTRVLPGTYTLTFSREGLVTRILLVRVAAGDQLVRDIDLPPAPTP